MKKEAAFESHFASCAAYFGCYYVKVPDMIPTRQRVRDYRNGVAPEALKPFDGVLITPDKTFCLEFKQGYTSQSTNQMITESRITKINAHTYFVVRKHQKAKKDVFTIEQDSNVIFSTDRLEFLVKAFKDQSFLAAAPELAV